jgi:hypothetical protein
MRRLKGSRSRAGCSLRLFLIAAALGIPGPAFAALTITRWSVDGGGSGLAQTGSFLFGGTSGQPDAGLLVGTGFTLQGGFWAPGGASLVGVGDDQTPGPDASLPREVRVLAAAPNPLLHRTVLAFELPEARPVEVRIFDVTGALVRTLANGTLPAGRHVLEWNVADAQGQRVAAGLYLVRFKLGPLQRSQKLVVLR